MSEEAKAKKSPIDEFRAKLRATTNLGDTVVEGLKHTNAKVRSLAIKVATRSQDYPFVKKHVLPLIKSEKSKHVLRTLADKTYRKELADRVKKLVVQKVAGKKEKAPEAAAPAAAPAAGDKA